MPNNLFVMVLPGELSWVRQLVALLRHPDPGVPELARQALLYLTASTASRNPGESTPIDSAG